MFQMNLKDKRTRRICAASASAAVIVAGGVTVGATVASATTGLALSTGTSFSTLDLGAAAATATTASQQTLQASVAMGAGTDTVTLTYGGNSTVGLTAASTAANIQTALNALASITAAGGVTVTRTAGTDLTSTTTTYQIVFNTGGARTAITAASSTGTLAVNSSTGGNTLGTTAGNLAQSLANAVFATKVTTASMAHLHVVLDSYTPPAAGTPGPTPALFVNQQDIANPIAPSTGWESVAVAGTSTLTSSSVSKNVLVTGNVPGAFTFHLVDDQGTPLATSDDVSSDPITMSVLDVEGVTATTADDWKPTVSAPSGVVQGVATTATVSFSDIATTDARGANTTGGLLGGYVAALTGISSTGAGLGAGPNNATAVTYNGTGGYTAVTPSSAAASPLVSTATFDKNGSGAPFTVASDGFASARTASTSVTDNLVTGFTSTATASVGKVLQTGGAVAVKVGQADITYTAKVTTLSAGTDKSGKDFYFTLTKGTNSPVLTADGTLVSTTTNSSIYKATTDSNGVATLKVSSSVTTLNTSYTVSVTTNGVAAANSTVTYANSAAGALQVTNTASELSPAVGAGVTLKGQLLDQFLAPYSPSGAEPQQVQFFVGAAGGATYTATDISGASTSGATQTVTLSSGTFSYSYTPTTAATAGQTTLFAVGYDTNGNGTIAAGEPRVGSSINWGSTVSAKTIAWLTPTANLTSVNLATPTDLKIGNAGQVFGLNGGHDDGQVKGQLKDTSGNPLPFRPVTLTSTGGVYFSTSSTPDTTATPSTGLLKTIDVVTDSNGYFTAYAVFTKAGDVVIEAKSGGTATTPDADGTVTVTTDAAATSYVVTVNSPKGVVGGNVPITGQVLDFFGSPVGGVAVNLDTSDSSVGSLGSATATTNSNGVFNVTFFVSSSVTTDTNTDVTASLGGAATAFKLPSPNNWPTWGGPTVADGVQSATGKISVAADTLTLNKPKSRVSAGSLTLSGTAKPGVKVSVFSTSGSRTQVASAMADATTGVWSAKVTISRNTTYQAETTTAVSGSVTVHVKSTIKVTTKVAKGGVLKVTVSGGPSSHGTITVWITHGKKTTKVVTHVTGGAKTWALKPGKGYTTVKATYASSGCDTSSAVSTRVKL
jgi:hypothetical protein